MSDAFAGLLLIILYGIQDRWPKHIGSPDNYKQSKVPTWWGWNCDICADFRYYDHYHCLPIFAASLSLNSSVLRRFSQFCEKRLLASSCLSVCRLSVRMEQLGSHWTNFHDMLYLSIFPNSVERKFKIHYNLTSTACILQEGRYTFLIVSRSVLLIMRNISAKFVEKIKTHILWSVTFFSKIMPFMI
jgi:hypothetical protein